MEAGMRGQWRQIGREFFLVFSLVALALQVAVPPGFMVGGNDGRDGGAARIVICTGHGPINAATDLGHSTRHGKRSPTCAFAGHGAPAQPGPAAPTVAIAWTPRPAALATPADQVRIGAGLAAPPPARGPPIFPDTIV
jgi:hypothetical protein